MRRPAALALAGLLSAAPAAAEAPDHVLVLTWGHAGKVVGTAWHPVPMTRDACRRALLPELARLQADVAHTSQFSGGVAAPQGEDRAAVETNRFGGVSFRAVAECRPVPR